MNTVIIIIIVVAGFIIAATKGKRKRFKYSVNEPWPFVQKNLQTPAEMKLYKALKEALPDHHIFVQVQVSRLVDVKKGHDFKQWFNRINRMSLDYVVCDKNLKTVAVIELDDLTHERADRKEADAKKNKVMEGAGIRLIRWKRIPSVDEIRQAVSSARGEDVGPNGAGRRQDRTSETKNNEQANPGRPR